MNWILKGIIETIQTNILRRIRKKTCCHSDSNERQPVNAGVKSSQ